MGNKSVKNCQSTSTRNGEFLFPDIGHKKSGPNAFLIEHAAQQSWPANVDNSFRAQAAEKAHKAFDEIKFHGTGKGRTGVWQTVGPVTESDNELWEPKNSSGRVTDLAIGNICNDDKCRLYAGTAGGGLWRAERAMHPDNPGWQHLSNGLASNNIGAVTIDVNDVSANTIYVGTGESNFNYSSAAGKGIFRSSDGGDSFSRLPTMIMDTEISDDPIDFTATRGISRVAIKPGNPDTLYVATTTALLGMTSVRGGQSTITGGLQPRVGLYRTQDGGGNWELLFVAPINTDSSAGTPEGLYEVLSGVKDVKFDPLDPDAVYISVADDGLYRSSPTLDGDSDFCHVFEIVTYADFWRDSYAAFDLTIKDGKTRNGLPGWPGQLLDG